MFSIQYSIKDSQHNRDILSLDLLILHSCNFVPFDQHLSISSASLTLVTTENQIWAEHVVEALAKPCLTDWSISKAVLDYVVDPVAEALAKPCFTVL